MPSPIVNPSWQAARNGLPGDAEAVNRAAHLGQFLAGHGVVPVCQGARTWSPATATGTAQATTFGWGVPLWEADADQPVVMPAGSTTTGRVQVAVQAAGAGADLQVTLCPDNGSGSPATGSPIASTIIPASHLTALSATGSLATAGPLATARNNTVYSDYPATGTWTQPAISANGAASYACPATTLGSAWTALIGGYDATASAAAANVAAVQYQGGGVVSAAVSLPALPQPAWYLCAAATSDTMVAAGGTNGSAHYSSVWTASWDPLGGALGVWSGQQSLPQASVNGAMAAWLPGDVVYVAGGSTDGTSGNATTATWWAAISSGQISSWTAGPNLPQPLLKPYLAVIGDWLVCAGGVSSSGTVLSSVWVSQLSATGVPGPWQAGPSLPEPAYAFSPGWNLIATDSVMMIVSGTTTGGGASIWTQALAVSPDGPAPAWEVTEFSVGESGVFQFGAWPSGPPGQWVIGGLGSTSYLWSELMPVPMISVPLPATGLTPGSTYHVLLHQLGGDTTNNYLTPGALSPCATPPAPYLTAAPGSGGPWTSHATYALAIDVWDQTPGGPVWHLWQDSGARVTTLVQAGGSGQLLGVLEATQFPAGSPEAVLAAVTEVEWDPTGTVPTGTVQLA